MIDAPRCAAENTALASAFGFDPTALADNRAGRASFSQLRPVWGAIAVLMVAAGLLTVGSVVTAYRGAWLVSLALAALVIACGYKIGRGLLLVASPVRAITGTVEHVQWEGSGRSARTARIRVGDVELSTIARFGEGLGNELEHVIARGRRYRAYYLSSGRHGELLSIETDDTP